MTRFFMSLLAFAFAAGAQAQLNGDGFYRVQNVQTERYIKVVDDKGSLNYSTTEADMASLKTISGFDNVVDQPGTIIYIKNLGNGYDLQTQGTGLMTIINHPVQIQKNPDGTYQAYGSSSGITKYLNDTYSFDDEGKVVSNLNGANQAKNKLRWWYILPVAANGDNYFGLKPDVKVGSSYYKSFYASFPFSFVSTGMKAFYVKKVDKAKRVAVYEEVNGSVPMSTPVFIQCSSTLASSNKLEILTTSVNPVSGNLLKGVYFCNPDAGPVHTNVLVNNTKTMRVLGVTSDGSLGMVTSSEPYIASNTAYLVVDSDTPAELKLLTQSEYENYKVFTFTAKSYTRVYGEENPEFEFTASEAGYSGKPTITCEATAKSPVGTYPIVISQGSVTGGQFVGVNGTLTITKAPLTATAANAEREYGDANPAFTVSYNGFKNNDNEASLTTKPTATTAATQASNAGTYDITVSGGAATNYNFTYAKGTLTVTKAKLTTTAADATREYGDANPAFTVSYNGFKNNDSEASLTTKPTATTAATQASNAGTYDITVSGGAATNYDFAYAKGTLTVTKAKLTATAADATREYGDANPAFSVSYNGFKNNDSEASLTTKPTATTTADAKTAAGTAEITLGGGVSDNYNITYVNGTLTITQAPLTVTADDKSRLEGEENPELTLSYTGFKNGETVDVLDVKPTASTTATVDSAPGAYTITVSGGSAKNYALAYVNGTLTVKAGSLMITAKSYTREYGEENPVFEYEVSGTVTLRGEPVISCQATKESPVGTYDIIVSKGTVENENVAFEKGTLTITPALLTVTALDAQREEGEENPTFVMSFSGFKNNENESVLTKLPEVTTEATKDSPVGEYAIVVSGGEAQNYIFDYVNGKLTVVARNAIAAITKGKAFDVYTVYGVKVRSAVTSLAGLPKGIYVVNGQKVLVR